MTTKLLGVLAMTLVAAGCAGVGTASPEEKIMATLGQWESAVMAEDIDAVMAVYSEKFEHYEYGTKATLQAYLADLIDQGMMAGAQASFEDLELQVDGSTATAYPVDLEAAFGSATLEFVLQEEESGDWLITSMEVEMN